MDGVQEILDWIYQLNEETEVSIKRSKLSSSNSWFYDGKTGTIHNANNSFFQIAGIKGIIDGEEFQQPILIQDEIGYLGIICKEIDGERYYLMQAKIEPGNINCVQISPTIQATRSNFMRLHGGRQPDYLEYFLDAYKYRVLADQIQSEQSSRFYKKRNRNIIIEIEGDIEVKPRFKWMSLSQIRELMKYKNLVNMDTRTVLSCLPYISDERLKISNNFFRNSVCNKEYQNEIVQVYSAVNDYKMFSSDNRTIVSLQELDGWEMTDSGIFCKNKYPYEVIYCDIEIEGREVKRWDQPLFKANGSAVFGLVSTIENGMMKFLVRLRPEIGCFDLVEIGPAVQKEAGDTTETGWFERKFFECVRKREFIKFDSVLSEEGGRFYHEENRNIVLEVPNSWMERKEKGYYWMSYAALNHLNLINNCLNIQLRNLMSVLEV